MGKRKLLLLCFYVLLTSSGWATSNIGFGTFTLSANTVKPGETLTIQTSLINYGPDTFTGEVGFNFAINGTQNINRSIFSNPIEGQTITIATNDSFSLLFDVVIQPQYLKPGTDIFVVWPIIENGNYVHDSLEVRFLVDVFTDVGEKEKEPALKVRYNKQAIEFDYNSVKQPVDLHVFDMNGMEVSSYRVESPGQLPFCNQPQGVYLVEATFADKTRKVYRIVNLDQ